MAVRAIVTVLLAALAAFHAVRTAAVTEAPDTWGERLWPSHPSVLTRGAMRDVGVSAAMREGLSDETLHKVDALGAKAPLAPEPFLIRAALAQMDGKEAHAERLLLAARNRDPRSEAARYFLADRYLRSGRIAAALTEMSVLAKLVPDASAQFAPSLAAYARTPGSVPELRRLFQRSPEFEPVVLDILAADPANADLIERLWSGAPARDGSAPLLWQTKLLGGLVAERNYVKAVALWERMAGAELAPSSLYNSDFRKLAAPPPFNWRFPNVGGVAEPADGGGLSVIYFGRQDALLAEELLLLPPGRYRIAMRVAGAADEQTPVAWTLRCEPGGPALAQLPIGRSAAQRGLAKSFAVPAGCPAQRLQLSGTAGEFARSSEFTVRGLTLGREGTQ